MTLPSVPLKRSPEGFSDSDSQPTTDHRRVAPAQTSTLLASSKVKTPTSFFSSAEQAFKGSTSSTLEQTKETVARTSAPFNTAGSLFQFPSYNPPPRSPQVLPPHPDTSRAPPTGTFYNAQPPTPHIGPQTTQAATATSMSSEPSSCAIPLCSVLVARPCNLAAPVHNN